LKGVKLLWRKIDNFQNDEVVASIKKHLDKFGSQISLYFGEAGKEALDLSAKAVLEIPDFGNTTSKYFNIILIIK